MYVWIRGGVGWYTEVGEGGAAYTAKEITSIFKYAGVSISESLNYQSFSHKRLKMFTDYAYRWKQEKNNTG